jgi:hypothetical protein
VLHCPTVEVCAEREERPARLDAIQNRTVARPEGIRDGGLSTGQDMETFLRVFEDAGAPVHRVAQALVPSAKHPHTSVLPAPGFR